MCVCVSVHMTACFALLCTFSNFKVCMYVSTHVCSKMEVVSMCDASLIIL